MTMRTAYADYLAAEAALNDAPDDPETYEALERAYFAAHLGAVNAVIASPADEMAAAGLCIRLAGDGDESAFDVAARVRSYRRA